MEIFGLIIVCFRTLGFGHVESMAPETRKVKQWQDTIRNEIMKSNFILNGFSDLLFYNHMLIWSKKYIPVSTSERGPQFDFSSSQNDLFWIKKKTPLCIRFSIERMRVYDVIVISTLLFKSLSRFLHKQFICHHGDALQAVQEEPKYGFGGIYS